MVAATCGLTLKNHYSHVKDQDQIGPCAAISAL